MVSEDRKSEGLALGLTITDNMTLTRLPALSSPAALDRGAREGTERLAVKCRSVRQPVGDLSGGNQQKVALARLLYHDADVLLLDEPTRGIDVGAKADVHQIVDALVHDGMAIVLISSDLPEVLAMSDRILVMREGRQMALLDAAEASQESVLATAMGQTPGGIQSGSVA